MNIGDKLREARKNKHLTLREVGEALSISYSGLAEIERGERNCNSETLRRLAEFYGVSTDYLLFGEKSPQMSNVQLAFYNGTKDLNDEQLQQVMDFVEFVKSKK